MIVLKILFLCFCVSCWHLVYSQASCLLRTHSQRTPASCQCKRHYNPSQHLTTHTGVLYRTQSIQLDETSPDHPALCRTTLGFKWKPCVSIEGYGPAPHYMGALSHSSPSLTSRWRANFQSLKNGRLSQVSDTEGFLLVSFLVIVFPVQSSYGISIPNLRARLLCVPSTLLHAFSHSRLFRSIVIPLLSLLCAVTLHSSAVLQFHPVDLFLPLQTPLKLPSKLGVYEYALF